MIVGLSSDSCWSKDENRYLLEPFLPALVLAICTYRCIQMLQFWGPTVNRELT